MVKGVYLLHRTQYSSLDDIKDDVLLHGDKYLVPTPLLGNLGPGNESERGSLSCSKHA